MLIQTIFYLCYDFYLLNKPLLAAGISDDMMSADDRFSEKWTVGQEAKLWGQLWHFEVNPSETRKGFIYFITLRSNLLWTKFVWTQPAGKRVGGRMAWSIRASQLFDSFLLTPKLAQLDSISQVSSMIKNSKLWITSRFLKHSITWFLGFAKI